MNPSLLLDVSLIFVSRTLQKSAEGVGMTMIPLSNISDSNCPSPPSFICVCVKDVRGPDCFCGVRAIKTLVSQVHFL